MLTPERKSQLCIKCQKCCKIICIDTDHLWTEENIDFFSVRGFLVKLTNPGMRKKLYIRLVFEKPCPYLSLKGCSIYEGRPSACKQFDPLTQPEAAATVPDCLWLKEKES